MTLVELQKTSSPVEDGSGNVWEFTQKLHGDKDTENIRADEVECSDDGPVVQLPFSLSSLAQAILTQGHFHSKMWMMKSSSRSDG